MSLMIVMVLLTTWVSLFLCLTERFLYQDMMVLTQGERTVNEGLVDNDQGVVADVKTPQFPEERDQLPCFSKNVVCIG